MAEDIKSLDQLKDAVTANAGGVLGSSSAEAQSLSAAPREPQRDAQGRAYATGKRKDAVARVWIKPGSGKVTVNGKPMAEYFARPVLQMILRQPFTVANVEGQFDVVATVASGRGAELLLVRAAPRRLQLRQASSILRAQLVHRDFPQAVGKIPPRVPVVLAHEVRHLPGLCQQQDSQMPAKCCSWRTKPCLHPCRAQRR